MSAAPQEIVEPLAHSLGMTSGIGTRSVVVDGVYTGELDGPFCYGEGKVQAMRELADWQGYDLSQCYAYSDSASDLPMLEAVGHPVAVNPDGKLERHARRHGWPIVIFSQRTKSVIRRTAASVATVGIASASFAAGTARRRLARRRSAAVPLTAGSPLIRTGRGMRASWRHWATRAPEESQIAPSSSSRPSWAKRVRNEQRSGPGAGTPRTCTVSSTVGTHATGRSVLNTAGGNASATRSSAIGVDRFVVGEREPARHLAVAGRLTRAEPDVAPDGCGSRSRSKIAGSGPSVGGGGTRAVLVARQVDRRLAR